MSENHSPSSCVRFPLPYSVCTYKKVYIWQGKEEIFDSHLIWGLMRRETMGNSIMSTGPNKPPSNDGREMIFLPFFQCLHNVLFKKRFFFLLLKFVVVGRNWILIQFPPPPQTVLHYRHYSRFCGIKQRRSGREIDPWLVFVHVANGSWFVQFNCRFGACFVRLKAQSKNRNSTWGIKFNASVFSSVPTAI